MEDNSGISWCIFHVVSCNVMDNVPHVIASVMFAYNVSRSLITWNAQLNGRKFLQITDNCWELQVLSGHFA